MQQTKGGSFKALPVQEHRHFIRHPLCFPLQYSIIDRRSSPERCEGRSTTINVSIGGLLFSARKAVPEKAKIVIIMPVQRKKFRIQAIVVHCRKNSETGLFNIGVRFFRVRDAFKVKLIEQMYLISEFRDLLSIQLAREVPLEEASRVWVKRYSERFRRLYW